MIIIIPNKDFIMEDSGEIAFKKGKPYIFKVDGYGTLWSIDEQGDNHWMKIEDVEEMMREE